METGSDTGLIVSSGNDPCGMIPIIFNTIEDYFIILVSRIWLCPEGERTPNGICTFPFFETYPPGVAKMLPEVFPPDGETIGLNTTVRVWFRVRRLKVYDVIGPQSTPSITMEYTRFPAAGSNR